MIKNSEEYMEVYNLLYDTSEILCKKAFEEQHKAFFRDKNKDVSKSYSDVGFQFTPPKEAKEILNELMPKARKGTFSREDALKYRQQVL